MHEHWKWGRSYYRGELSLTLLLKPCCVWFNFHPSMVIPDSSWPRSADSFLSNTHMHTHHFFQATNRVLPTVLRKW